MTGHLPEKLLSAAEMYAGCVAGGIQMDEYLSLMKDAGFTNIIIQKDKPIIVPEDILSNYLLADEINQYKSLDTAIRSITVC